jgi:hypothetical protein
LTSTTVIPDASQGTNRVEPVEVKAREEAHTSRSKLEEELKLLVQKRRVSATIAAWAKLSAEDWCNAASGTRLEADYALSFTPRIPLYSSTLSSLTAELNEAADQPVLDNQPEIRRVKISDVIGEAGVDPFDEMLDNVDNTQFLPPE